VLGEMVVYSDKEHKIMPFSKIRKHVSRSGSFMGVYQDSPPHAWEHLMLVFFDVLVLDDEAVLRHGLQKRRSLLRRLIKVSVGCSMRSEWSLLEFKTGDGIMDFKQAFARSLANHQEGLILKPLHGPYFPLAIEPGQRRRCAQFFIKVKQDYLADMGGQRDLGDFAVMGASFEAQVAPKTDVRPLHWTHFHLGCCSNLSAVQLHAAKPSFQIVAVICFDKCISKSDLAYLNTQGFVRQTHSASTTTTETQTETSPFTITPFLTPSTRPMTTAFTRPFVVEVLGAGYTHAPNEAFAMLRHPRVTKIHTDRTWADAVTLEQLDGMARGLLDRGESGGGGDGGEGELADCHARDVLRLAARYRREMDGKGHGEGEEEPTQTQRETDDNTASSLSLDAQSSFAPSTPPPPSTPSLPLHSSAHIRTPPPPSSQTQMQTQTQSQTQAEAYLPASSSSSISMFISGRYGQKRSSVDVDVGVEGLISPPPVRKRRQTMRLGV
jgi:DNA ligase-4